MILALTIDDGKLIAAFGAAVVSFGGVLVAGGRWFIVQVVQRAQDEARSAREAAERQRMAADQKNADLTKEFTAALDRTVSRFDSSLEKTAQRFEEALERTTQTLSLRMENISERVTGLAQEVRAGKQS